MFDPHRTRRSDRRFYTRKGQVLQASRVNVNPTIDQRLVPIYKNYLLKNNLITAPPPPPPQPEQKIKPLGIAIEGNLSGDYDFYPFTEFTLTTSEIFNIEATFPSSTISAVLIFQQQTNGYFRFETIVFSGSIHTQKTDNVKCYYKIIQIISESNYIDKSKGLYHTSPSNENVFLSFDTYETSSGQELSISSQVNIEL